MVTLQPAAVTLPAGGAATFTAGASGAPPPSVQWSESVGGGAFTRISGATSTTLTVGPVTLAMNGNHYRAVFRNTAGRATTRAALLTVTPGVVATLEISPPISEIVPGASRTFHAEGFDAGGDDLGDVTAATTFTIAPDGVCGAAACSADGLGPHTVTGSDGGVSATATLDVAQDTITSLTLAPAATTVVPSGTVTYTAEGYNASAVDVGDVTAASTFTLAPDGSCVGAVCSATLSGLHTVSAADGAATGAASLIVLGRYVELIFSRTEVTAADGNPCHADDAGVARLDTVVEPFLQSLGLAASGSIETGPTQSSALWCTHYQETMAASWSVASQLASDGWTFLTHSQDYPTATQWAALTPAQQWDETCGAAQTIDSHGLPGADTMFLWPNDVVSAPALTAFVEPCFATNRIRSPSVATAVTGGSAFVNSPFQQPARGLTGGHCTAPGAACDAIAGATTAYVTPTEVISAIQSLQPGQVLTMQVYLTVAGTNPAYATNPERWDCTASDPAYHWTNDVERYCWNDLQQILDYLAQSGIGLTQPRVVDAAFGRTGFSDTAVPRP